ncbi:MAG: DUF2232 domain-containing protein [Desulfitobacteriaceae bacterium]
MYWSDRKSLDWLAMMALVTFPLAGTAWELWSWVWEIFILLSVFWTGTRKGLLTTGILLSTGYGLAALFFRWPGLTQMGYLPWAGLITVFGWERKWPERVNVFWSLALAGFLGALPMVGIAQGGIDPKVLNDVVNASIQSYRTSGMLAATQQLGYTEEQLRTALEQMLPLYMSLIPSFAALVGFVEYSLANYLALRFIRPDKKVRVPFARWRLPWYAVWGAILGLAGYLLGDQYSLPFLKGLGLNLMVIYAVLTVVLGTTIYVYVLKSSSVPRLVKWGLLLINLFYFLFSLLLLMMFGLFDLVFNFRKLPESDV